MKKQSDDEELMAREKQRLEDLRNQARWKESLNLYAEALKIYQSIKDDDNAERLKRKMASEYGKNARMLEREGRYQDAANLYYLTGDHEGVRRMKGKKPDLVILYDSEGGGLAKLARDLQNLEKVDDRIDHFSKPNVGLMDAGETEESAPKEAPPVLSEKSYPVKMPKKIKTISFCPYCGEQITTRKQPKFCPFCGEELN